MRVAALPLISSVRDFACNLVALDGLAGSLRMEMKHGYGNRAMPLRRRHLLMRRKNAVTIGEPRLLPPSSEKASTDYIERRIVHCSFARKIRDFCDTRGLLKTSLNEENLIMARHENLPPFARSPPRRHCHARTESRMVFRLDARSDSPADLHVAPLFERRINRRQCGRAHDFTRRDDDRARCRWSGDGFAYLVHDRR